MKIFTYDIHTEYNHVMDIWAKATAANDDCYFLSQGWVDNWIKSLPDNCAVKLVAIIENGTPSLAFFLGRPRKSPAFAPKQLFLNATGYPLYDKLCIEYNSIILKNGCNYALHKILDQLPYSWDELVLPGLSASMFPATALNSDIGQYKAIINRTVPSPYVDLNKVRACNGDYLSLLGSSTRSQLRRSRRHYEKKGPVVLETATNVDDAKNIYDELVALHQNTWDSRGKKGAFSTKYFYEFHKGLIQDRFSAGEIQLLRVTCDMKTIGCLYNLVFKGIVYFYQSGFQYEDDNKKKPGFTTHAEAIMYNAEIGNSVYDFQGGNDSYKLNLSTDSNQLIWARIQKPLLKLKCSTKFISL